MIKEPYNPTKAPNEQYLYMRKVEAGANNNKFYEMKNLGNGKWLARWGREPDEGDNGDTKEYDMSRWHKDYIKRTKVPGPKEYTDVTDHKTKRVVESVATNSQGQIIATDPEVVNLIQLLQSYAGESTKANYNVVAADVTQKQVDDAQALIDTLAKLVKDFGTPKWDLNKFNGELTKLMIVIPRKMKKVVDHLIAPTHTKEKIEERISSEQDILDAMASQVTQQTAQAKDAKADHKTTKQQTLLELLGLEMHPASKQEIAEVKAMAQDHGHRILRVFKVVNKQSQTAFDNYVAKAANKTRRLLWHGSKCANWWFIIQQSLRIRPSNAGYNGSAFADGIYFAIQDDKSMGYVDGGRWDYNSNRRIDKVYLGVYDVHVGKQMIVQDSYQSGLNSKSTARALEILKANGDYDSTWAVSRHSGYVNARLNRDEIIVYRPEQCTIRYLVEFKA